MKKIIIGITPPFLVHLCRILFAPMLGTKRFSGWKGNYVSWKDAILVSEGYDSPSILEKVQAAALVVKKGEAVFERDSVLFNKTLYNYPLISILFKISGQQDNQLSLIDFGGALGSCYFQNRGFLGGLKTLNWSVVEQEHFVQFGKSEMEDSVLRFYSTIKQAQAVNRANTVLLSSVLQYLENPYGFLDSLADDNFEYLIIDRTSFSELPEDRITVQYVPEEIYKASYPTWIFSKEKFLSYMMGHYLIEADFEPYPGQFIDLGETKAFFEGFLFKRTNVHER